MSGSCTFTHVLDEDLYLNYRIHMHCIAREQHWWFIKFPCLIISMANVTKPPQQSADLSDFFKGSIPVVPIAADRKVVMDHTVKMENRRSCNNCRRRLSRTSSDELHRQGLFFLQTDEEPLSEMSAHGRRKRRRRHQVKKRRLFQPSSYTHTRAI